MKPKKERPQSEGLSIFRSVVINTLQQIQLH